MPVDVYVVASVCVYMYCSLIRLYCSMHVFVSCLRARLSMRECEGEDYFSVAA